MMKGLPFFQNKSVRSFYELEGDGPPLVLHHGRARARLSKTMSFLILFYILLSSFVSGSTPAKAQEWQSIENDNFIVYYLDYLSDAEWVLEQLEISSTIVQNVYPHTLNQKVLVYLYLVPNENASWYTQMARGNTLHFMTPTLAKENGGPYVDNLYYQHVIMHEYIHAPFYEEINYNPPAWFSQGLAEYIPMFRANFVGMLDKYHHKLGPIYNLVKNGEGYIASVTDDPYGGGAYLLKYMYEVYGQDAVVRVIRSDSTSFWDAISTELNVTIREFEDYWLKWACSEFEADPELYPTVEFDISEDTEEVTEENATLIQILNGDFEEEITWSPYTIPGWESSGSTGKTSGYSWSGLELYHRGTYSTYLSQNVYFPETEVTLSFWIKPLPGGLNVSIQCLLDDLVVYTERYYGSDDDFTWINIVTELDANIGTHEIKFVIPADWDAGTDWETLPMVVIDEVTLTIYARAPMPAVFEFSNLQIFYPGVIPPEVEAGQTVSVTVSIEAENVGELKGGCTVELNVNGEVIDSKEVVLEAGASETVLFELTRGEGSYEVEVEGLTESLTVNTPPEPEPEEVSMGSIHVTVYDVNRAPVRGVSVFSTAQPEGTSSLDKLTSSDGEVTFEEVLAGEYVLKTMKEGYESATCTSGVTPGSMIELVIYLEEAADPEPEPEPEPEKKGIPGFPYLSIAFGLILVFLLRNRFHI